VLQTIDERNAKKVGEARVELINRTIEQSWKERVAKSRELHADYDTGALATTVQANWIGPGSMSMNGLCNPSMVPNSSTTSANILTS